MLRCLDRMPATTAHVAIFPRAVTVMLFFHNLLTESRSLEARYVVPKCSFSPSSGPIDVFFGITLRSEVLPRGFRGGGLPGM
jgi:hypothetical protein